MYISFHFSYNIARLLLLTKFSTSLSFPTYKLSITNNITFMRLRYSFAVRAPIDFGNNRIEPIGNRFSVGKFNRIYRYFSFGKLPFSFGKFGFGFGFSIYRTDLLI